MYLSRVAGYGCTGSLLFCGFKWYDSAGSVLALSANCVHTPLRVLVVLLNMTVPALSLLDARVVRCCVGWHGCACVFMSKLRARAAVYLSCCVRRWVFAVRWSPLGLLDAAVSGTVARVLPMLIACTRHCILELRHTAVSALSVSRSWFELYDAAVSSAAAPARAAHSVYAVGYSLGGGFRLGCWIRWSALPPRLLI